MYFFLFFFFHFVQFTQVGGAAQEEPNFSDDEVSAEIISIQKQLKERLRNNNEKRMKYLTSAVKKIHEEFEKSLHRAENGAVVSIYENRNFFPLSYLF